VHGRSVPWLAVSVQRIYLDQWAWINLSKAVFQEPGHASTDADAWMVARASVANGLASFPLSVVHYMETIRDADLNRRRRRGAIMGGLSQFHTIAPPGDILPMEIDRALKATFGRPQQPRDVQVFGRGFRHAFGMTADALTFPEGITRHRRKTVEDQLEVALLIGWPVDQDIWRFAQQPDQFGAAFAQREEELGERLASFDFNKGNKLKRAILTDAISEILDEINDGFQRAGVAQDELRALGQRGHDRLLPEDPHAARGERAAPLQAQAAFSAVGSERYARPGRDEPRRRLLRRGRGREALDGGDQADRARRGLQDDRDSQPRRPARGARDRQRRLAGRRRPRKTIGKSTDMNHHVPLHRIRGFQSSILGVRTYATPPVPPSAVPVMPR
jgi:hypothetical protein